jgi:Tol biopolymer transport system component
MMWSKRDALLFLGIAALLPAGTCPAQENQALDRRGEEGFRALYTMNRDGSEVEFLAAAPGMISSSSPEWSHDGTMVAFDAVPQVGELQLAHVFVYAVQGPFKGMFKDLGCGNVPSWSPDDSKIAYMVNGGNPAGAEPGIWIMDSDGSNRQWICRGWYPRFSPDGRELCVYAYFEDSLHMVDLETKEIRKILGETMEVSFGGATWSPDGKQLVFLGTRDGKEYLATVSADGSPDSIKILFTQEGPDRQLIGPPSWSPDGTQIALAMQDTSAPDPQNRRWHHTYLYCISAQVPGFPILLEPGRKGLVNRSMMWSPDSRKIVFSSQR